MVVSTSMPGVEQHQDVFPALPRSEPGTLRVRELVHQANPRVARQNGVGIHLLEMRSAILDAAARDDFRPSRLSDGVFSAVRLEIADDDIDSLGLQLEPLLEHAVGLPHTGRVAHQHLQLPAAASFSEGRPRRPCLPRSGSAGLRDSRRAGSRSPLQAVPDEDLRDPILPGEPENGLNRIFVGQHLDLAPDWRARSSCLSRPPSCVWLQNRLVDVQYVAARRGTSAVRRAIASMAAALARGVRKPGSSPGWRSPVPGRGLERSPRARRSTTSAARSKAIPAAPTTGSVRPPPPPRPAADPAVRTIARGACRRSRFRPRPSEIPSGSSGDLLPRQRLHPGPQFFDVL